MEDGLDNFQEKKQYLASTYSDVSESDWFYENVKRAYEYGLMIGDNANTFRPYENVTLAEAITLASRLHSVYYTGSDNFESSNPWYQTYVDYATANGILYTTYRDYNCAATRADFAIILSSALPGDVLEEVNQVSDGDIPDVKAGDVCGAAVYKLYRAGILVGNDMEGTFFPNSNIRRCEVATIVSRMVIRCLRIGHDHKLTYHEAVAATIDTPGNVEYWHCDYCGNNFADENATTILETTEISITNHTEEMIPGKEPTCTEPGLSEGKKCAVCGEILVEPEVDPALGHDWDEGVVTVQPTYTKKGEKIFTCLRCGETKTEDIPEIEDQSDSPTDFPDENTPSTGTEEGVESGYTFNNPTFVIEKKSATRGEKSVAVTVAVKNNPGIASVGMMVSYDDGLKLEDIVYNDDIGGSYMLPQTMGNPVKLIWVSLTDVTDDWVLATLYFNVKEDAALGYHQIAATYDEEDVFDETMNDVSFDIIYGSICVVE